MRVNALANTAVARAAPSARRFGGGFSVSEDPPSNSSAPAGGLRAVTSVDALIALQGVEDPLERRKRAITQGRKALDILEGVKIGLLDGTLDNSAMGRLKSVAEGLKQSSGEEHLDAVLAEIELRVEVELAKAQRN
jgi:Class II flagellar assembly regulator